MMLRRDFLRLGGAAFAAAVFSRMGFGAPRIGQAAGLEGLEILPVDVLVLPPHSLWWLVFQPAPGLSYRRNPSCARQLFQGAALGAQSFVVGDQPMRITAVEIMGPGAQLLGRAFCVPDDGSGHPDLSVRCFPVPTVMAPEPEVPDHQVLRQIAGGPWTRASFTRA